MTANLVRASTDARVRTLTLASPQRRNALDAPLLRQLRSALDAAAADDALRVVVLTAEGSTFCSGADLHSAGSSASFSATVPVLLADVLDAMVDHPKPIIARVQGHVAGGGIGLVAACDLAVAADVARFAFAEVRLGVVPAVIAPYVLRKLSPTAAGELMLTGERVVAQVVADAGLLQRVVASDALDAVVTAWTDQIVRGGPQAVAVTKRVLTRVPWMDRRAARDWTTAVSAATFASSEAAQGIEAFAQRRDPPWVNP